MFIVNNTIFKKKITIKSSYKTTNKTIYVKYTSIKSRKIETSL